MKFNNRFQEMDKIINENIWIIEEADDWQDIEENLKEIIDAEIQDISHQMYRDNTLHEARNILKIELRKYLRKSFSKFWKNEQIKRGGK